ncbi:hypothetical protein [Candidatus Uabimicrobium amorphum]|uniref:Uncharacterized protein n=1 Tax=Uabimicrobium amorphum TaxID=2596890 RepID=A0A5S9IV06_UABAM|nr:hypothetical protein [Candidatus Uabimicrobium amorphum]BBM87821.1 hypothetical protein UABAM_06236 [Candidatus Uabimicrobium amorphum]
MKYISTFMILIMFVINAHADEKKIDDIIKTITSIKVDHLDLEAIKKLEDNLKSIISNTNELQQKVSQHKSRLQKEEKLIKIINDASKKELSSVVLTAIGTLEYQLTTCKDYFTEAKANTITQKHVAKVKEYQQRWQKLHDKLAQLQKHVTDVENANEDLKKQTLLKDTELQKRLKGILSAIAKYDEYVQKNDLSKYKSQVIGSLQQDLQKRLARSAYSSKAKIVRDEYQQWKSTQAQTKSSVELEALAKFVNVYNKHESDLKSGSENNFFSSVIAPLIEEATQRKKAVVKENELFTKLEKEYKTAMAAKQDAQAKLQAAKDVRKKITEYEQLVQKNEISSYHRKNVTPYSRELDKTIASITQEVDVFNSLQKEYQDYTQQKYSNIVDERNKIDDTLKKVVVYANLLQTERIKGYYSDQVKKIAEGLQKRQEIIVAEQNVVSPFRIARKNWEEKQQSWTNANEEKDSIEKVLNAASKYLEVLGEGKVSKYYENEVKTTKESLSQRLNKINGENTAFANVTKENDSYKGQQFTSLDAELAGIQKVLSVVNNYQSLETAKKIAIYQKEQVAKMKTTLENRQKILNNEKSIYAKTQTAFDAWKNGEKNLDNELKNIASALASVDSYNSMIAKFEASQFFKNQVIAMKKKLDNRKDQIELEKKSVAEIKKLAALPQAKTLQEYSKNLQKLQTSISNYQMELKSQKISNYHVQEVESLSLKNKAQMETINKVIASFKTVKMSYNSWKIKSRWQNWDQENKKLQEITTAVQKYKESLGNIQDANAEEIKTWLANINDEQKKLDAEKKFYSELDKLSDTLGEGGYMSGEDELADADKLTGLCDEYIKKVRGKEMTNHYQRGVRKRKRKAQDASKKVKRETYMFRQVESSYNFWKNNSPWQNKADEERALDKAFAKIQEYNDELQFRKITTYQKSNVGEWKDELQKRKDALLSGG